MTFVLDTHPLVFYLLEPSRLSPKVQLLFADTAHRFLIPTMSIMEIGYLVEVGRIETDMRQVVGYVHNDTSCEIVGFGTEELYETIECSTRDPFDRIILATAKARSLPIVTRDRWMRRNYDQAVW